MGIFTRWFKKSDSEDYEQVLATLAQDIASRQQSLNELRLRERRTTLLYTLYAFAAWGIYVAIWYAQPRLLPDWSSSFGGHPRGQGLDKVVKGVPVVAGPILILFMRRIVQVWYKRIGDAEEKTLKDLRHKQRTTIEEIKKKTNYYSTRNLIERYDDSKPSTLQAASQGRPQPLAQPPNGQLRPPIPPNAPRPVTPQPQPGLPVSPGLQAHFSPQPPQPLPPPRKQWYDKLADALLGDDGDMSSGNASGIGRYALICERCFKHNGLVKESMWEDTQYVCPKCGHFNPSPRARRQAAQLSQPPSATSSPLKLHPPTNELVPPSPLSQRQLSASNRAASPPSQEEGVKSNGGGFAPPLGEPVGVNGKGDSEDEKGQES